MNKKRNINMADPYFSPDEVKLIHQEVDNILTNALSMSSNVKHFEEDFAKKMSVKYAVAMNACTSTLEAALCFHNIKGKEVIIPSQTFIATGMAVHLNGGIPVFAEISPNTFCLDLDDVKKRVTENTAGIILVHMTGIITPDIFEFKKFCKEKDLFLIEDAAHSPGAILNKSYAGSIGDAGCFSFFPSKVITSGEGGMLITNNKEVADFARSFQNRGRDMSAEIETYKIPGRNVRITEFSALLGRIQLKKLDEYLSQRRQIANIYKSELSHVNNIEHLFPDDMNSSAFWKVPIILDSKINRVKLTNELKLNGINVDWAYNPPLHLQPVFIDLYNTYEGQLPITEDCLKRHICLPCHPRMNDEDAYFVAEKIKDFISRIN